MGNWYCVPLFHDMGPEDDNGLERLVHGHLVARPFPALFDRDVRDLLEDVQPFGKPAEDRVATVEMRPRSDADVDLRVAAPLVADAAQAQRPENMGQGVEFRRERRRVASAGLDDVAADDPIKVLSVVESLPDEGLELDDSLGRVLTQIERSEPRSGGPDDPSSSPAGSRTTCLIVRRFQV